MIPRSLAILCCVVFLCGGDASAEDGDDILTRTTTLADRAPTMMASRVAALFLSRQWAAKPGRVLEEAIPLEEGELVHILAMNGRVLLSSDPFLMTAEYGYRFPGNEQASRKALWEKTLSEAKGVGSYRSLSAVGGDVVRRELGWVRVSWDGLPFVFLVEREHVVTTRFSDEPLTGKWMGAYSMKGSAVFFHGSEIESWQDAGQLSALIIQDQAQCTIRMVSPRWEMEGSGLVISNRFTAGEVRHVHQGDEELWFLVAEYDPELDEIRGTVRVGGPRLYSERSIFLERYTEEP